MSDPLDGYTPVARDPLDGYSPVTPAKTTTAPAVEDSFANTFPGWKAISGVGSVVRDWTIGPFEQASRVLAGPTPAERQQVLASMTPDQRAAYLESGRGAMTPLQVIVNPPPGLSNEERVGMMMPFTNLGLIGSLGARGGTESLPLGRGRGFIPATTAPPAIPRPSPRPLLALPPGREPFGMMPEEIAAAQGRLNAPVTPPAAKASGIQVTSGEYPTVEALPGVPFMATPEGLTQRGTFDLRPNPAKRMAPVEYAGYQEGFGRAPGFHQYTLTEDVSPTLVKGSTVSEASLGKAGLEVPPFLTTQATTPPEGLQTKVPQAPESPGLPFKEGSPLHAGLPIPDNIMEWLKRLSGSQGEATTNRVKIPTLEELRDNPDLANQMLRDVNATLKPPRQTEAPTASIQSEARPTATPIAPGDLSALPRNYSDMLAGRNRVRPLMPGGFHGMNQVADAAPDSAYAFRRAANAEKTWAYAVTEAKDLIDQRVGSGAWDRFKQTMSESQQRGNVRRWADLANEVRDANPTDVPTLYRDRAGDALEAIGEGVFKRGETLANRAETNGTEIGRLKAAKELQQLLTQSFESASQNVTHILDDATYQAALKSPEFQRALPIWNEAVGKDLQTAHIANAGHVLRPEYLGETGQYFPMTGTAAAEQAALGLKAPRPGGPYSRPGNPLNFRRGGLSPEYDLSDTALQQRVGAAGWASDHAQAIAQAEQEGLIRRIPPGTTANKVPRTYDFQGSTYNAERVGDHVMPSWVRDEIGPIFERFRPPSPPGGLVGKAGKAIIGLNTKLGVDKYFHYMNETGLLGSQAPTLGTSPLGRIFGSLPGVKTVNAFTQLFDSLTDTQRPIVRDMLRNGEWYPRMDKTGTLTGMAKRDLAGRLAFRESILRWKPDATPQQLYDAASRFGEYNPQLAPNAIRSIKQSRVLSPLAPFVTAGNAFVRNALGTLTAQSPAGGTGRLVAAATGGVPAALGIWTAVHVGMTGEVPDPTAPDFKLLQVPYDVTPGGRTKYLNIGKIISPLGLRGASASGIRSAIETLSRDGSSRQAVESAMQDILNAQLHPYTGPVVKVLSRLGLGVDPMLQIHGRDVGFRRASGPADTLSGKAVNNLGSALRAINPGLEKLAEPAGRWFGELPERDPDEGMGPMDQVMRALGYVTVEDTGARAEALSREQAAMERAAAR